MNKGVAKVEFLFKNLSDLQNVVSGKKKKNALKIHKGMHVANIHFNNGSVFELRSPIAGKLIELNRSIAKGNLESINSQSESNGFLMILDPPFS